MTIAWETTTTRVTLGGWVADAQTGTPLPSVGVAITTGPAAFTAMLGYAQQKYGAQWATLAERPDRTLTANDGRFVFGNLPPGAYTLAAAWLAAGSRYKAVQKNITVAAGKTATLALALPPTGVRGQITDANNVTIMLAQVLLQDSGEYVFSDETGNFQLLGVEAGRRTLLVRPPSGTTSQTYAVTLTQGRVTTKNIQLTAS